MDKRAIKAMNIEEIVERLAAFPKKDLEEPGGDVELLRKALRRKTIKRKRHLSAQGICDWTRGSLAAGARRGD